MVNKKLIPVVVILLVLVVAFIVLNLSPTQNTENLEPAQDWINFELKNVNTGEEFKISELGNQPVLLESFAVWCPTCTRQQRETKKLHEEVGDSIISISIDTDPNEDEEKVRQHTETNEFDWIYVVAPREFTQSLIDQFGVSIINAPSAPMILICDSQNVKKLGGGVKSASKLKENVKEFC